MQALTDFIRKLLDTSDFPARWTCGRWSPLEGWLHIISDLTIFLAYLAIPGALFVLVRHRRDFVFPRIVWLFIAFILSCGIGHGVESLMFWWPAYRVTAVIKVFTAVVSVATVVALVRALPLALRIPSLTREHRELSAALRETRSENDALAAARFDLERRSAELAFRERRLRDAMVGARACAFSWNLDTDGMEWEIGFQPMLRAAGIEHPGERMTWARLIGPDAARTLFARAAACPTDQVLHMRFAMSGREGRWDIRMSLSPEVSTSARPRILLGLVGMVPFEPAPGPDPPPSS